MNTLTSKEMSYLEGGGWLSWDCFWSVAGTVAGGVGMVGSAAHANAAGLYVSMWFFASGIVNIGKNCY